MNTIVLAILWPFLTAIVLALVNGRYRLEKALAVLSSLGLTGWVFWLLFFVRANGVQAMVVGGWQAPWGIAFVADLLACIMLCLSMGVGAVVIIYTCWTVTEQQQKHFFYPLFFLLLVGVNWAFVTGDLFNLFVAYEVMLIASYGMMMVGASRAQVRQTMKYIAINCVGSTFFVAGCGFVYATVGTLNLADLAVRTAALTGEPAAMVSAVSLVLLMVFALKTAAFPIFFWLPDTYPVVPAGVNGYFAGLLTKVGLYSLLRVFGDDISPTRRRAGVGCASGHVGFHDAFRRARRDVPMGDATHPVLAHHQPGGLHGDGHRAGGHRPAGRRDRGAEGGYRARHRRYDLLCGPPHRREELLVPDQRHLRTG